MSNLINHIAFLLDGSGSMSHLVPKVISLTNKFLKEQLKQSQSTKQEVRISIYGFSSTLKNLCFDVQVNEKLEVDRSFYAGLNTALVQSTITVIDDLSTISQKYGDHSFLIYIFSDGANNLHRELSSTLKSKIEKLPDNWTVAVLVPGLTELHEAKQYGFPAGNIQVWDASSEKGAEEAFEKVSTSTTSYYAARSVGTKGLKNLFTPDVSFSAKDVKKLEPLKAGEYGLFPVHPRKTKIVIKDFVESWTTKPYVVGSSYFQLTKPETIQPYKQVAILEKSTGKVYSGANARELLGLPDYEIKIAPASHPKYTIFVQSSSVNRLLVPGTQLLVML